MKFTLALTHNCNLACAYCYAGAKLRKEMPAEIALRIVDFAFRISPPGRAANLNYFGGEPMLCFPLIQQLTAHIRQRERETGKQFTLGITTNGTLLKRGALEYLRSEDIDLCVSLDGPAAIHNRYRVYRDGRGSFDDVVAGLREALKVLPSVQVNSVYGPATLGHLVETVALLDGLGATMIHLNPDISAVWTRQAQDELDANLMGVAEYYIRSFERGRELAINVIDSKIMLFIKGGHGAEDLCGMGETEWAFAPSGNIYPCERFIGDDTDASLRLGNIQTGIDPTRRCQLIQQRGNVNQACADCGLRPYCMNWCGCTNYHMTGRANVAAPALCAIERASIRAARHVFETLSQQENPLFLEHLARAFHAAPSGEKLSAGQAMAIPARS